MRSLIADIASNPVPVIDLGIDDAEERTDEQFGEKMFFIRGGQYKLLDVPIEEGNSRWIYHVPIAGHAYIHALSAILHWQLGGKNLNLTVRKFASIVSPEGEGFHTSQVYLLGVLSSWLNCGANNLFLGKLTVEKSVRSEKDFQKLLRRVAKGCALKPTYYGVQHLVSAARFSVLSTTVEKQLSSSDIKQLILVYSIKDETNYLTLSRSGSETRKWYTHNTRLVR
jgi:hypothetical protein